MPWGARLEHQLLAKANSSTAGRRAGGAHIEAYQQLPSAVTGCRARSASWRWSYTAAPDRCTRHVIHHARRLPARAPGSKTELEHVIGALVAALGRPRAAKAAGRRCATALLPTPDLGAWPTGRCSAGPPIGAQQQLARADSYGRCTVDRRAGPDFSRRRPIAPPLVMNLGAWPAGRRVGGARIELQQQLADADS